MVIRLVRKIKQMMVIENLKKIKYGFKPSSDQAVFDKRIIYTSLNLFWSTIDQFYILSTGD